MSGRLAAPALPSLPVDLGSWRWERQDYFLRLVCVSTGWTTPWRDEETPEELYAIARRYLRVMELDEDTMATTKQTARSINTFAFPELPNELVDWRWQSGRARSTATGSLEQQYQLLCTADGWTTNLYTKPERAIAEARRRVLSQPKPQAESRETVHRAETDLDDMLHEQLVTGGWSWESARLLQNGWHHRLRALEGGTIGGRRLTRARIIELLGIVEPDLLPGSSIETTLQSHGWSWEPETDHQGRPEYRFRNRYTHEVCRMPSLEKRLEFDQRHPVLYELLAEGFVPGPDAGGVFRRQPGGAEHIEVDTSAIVRGRYQPRRTFSDAEIEELAASIKEHGILTRPKVFLNERGDYELIAGERRLRASKLLGLERIPVEVCEYTLAQIHEISIIDNLQREGLTPVEEGIAYERMASELGVSESELSRRLGKNRGYIQQRRAIGRAAPEVQAALLDGTLTFSQARGLCLGAADNHKAQLAALKKICDQLKSGARIDEKSVQREVEKAVLKQVKKELEALGWKITDSVRTLLWAETERPQAYTSAELLAIAREKRRPGSTRPDAREITKDEQAILEIKGYQDYKDFVPWVVFSRGGDMQILAPVEVPALVEQVQQEFAAMQERYRVAGWELAHAGGNSFRATSSQKRTESPWLWNGVEELIAKIEAGQISDKPEPKQKQDYSSPAWTCARCTKQFRNTDYTWRNEGQKVCEECANVIDTERTAQVATQAGDLASRWQASLQQLDLDLLQLITMRMADNNRGEIIGLSRWTNTADIAKAVLAWDRDALIEMFTRLVAAHEMERWPGWQSGHQKEVGDA